MSSNAKKISATFNLRMPQVFQLSPVFNCISSAKHHIRTRLQKKALEQFNDTSVKTVFLLLQDIRIDGSWTTLTTLDSPVSQEAEQQQCIPISLKDEEPCGEDYIISSFSLRLFFDRLQRILSLRVIKEINVYDSCRLERVKIVQSARVCNQLQMTRHNPKTNQTGVLSMDNKHRLMVETWDTNLPVVGVWVRGPYDLCSMQVYDAVNKFAHMQFEVKCCFDQEGVSFLLLLFCHEVPEAHVLTLSEYSQTVSWETQNIKSKEQVIEFTGDASEVSGMEFTLRDKTTHSIDFCSPIKSLETRKLEQELSKIQEKIHNSPEFTRYDNDKQQLNKRVSLQEKEIDRLKQQVLLLKKELQRNRQRSGYKQSLIKSPQYELWSSRSKVHTPQRLLQESDLKVGESSKGSTKTDKTKQSDNYGSELNEFRRVRQVIMEQQNGQYDEPWNEIELIE